MATYQVKFFKRLLSSDGHPAKVLQRSIVVDGSETSEDAVRTAQIRFAVLERIPDWKLHADLVEAESEACEPQASARP